MPETPNDPSFRHTLRVYWEDTDAGGVVFYANYLKFFERARTEWLRHTGIEQQALRDATGAIFVVSDTRVRYLRPARLDDRLSITVLPTAIGRASMSFEQRAWRLPPNTAPGDAEAIGAGSELLAEGEIRIGCVDAQTLRPRRFPSVLVERLTP